MKTTEKSEKLFNSIKDEIFGAVPGNIERFSAAGLVGEGSECLGFDDEFSTDHDSGAGFQIYLPEKEFYEYGDILQRAYNAAIKRVEPSRTVSPTGEKRRGVFSIPAFYRGLTGCAGVPTTAEAWLSIPEYALCSATDGKVFFDGLGEFSEIRKGLCDGYPRDVYLKKLSVRLIEMAQSGQYNFLRCANRKQYPAAALALNEFVKASVSAVFLINNRFSPYYKWCLKAMEALPILGNQAPTLGYLLTERTNADTLTVKAQAIEDFCSLIADFLRENGLSDVEDNFLEPHAYRVREKIENSKIKAMHIMAE